VKVVWDAWTDAEQVAKWWGPRGFSLTTHAKDLRPGGVWHYTMHGPDGTDYPNKTKYYEVVERAKLVYDHGGNDERAPMFRVTVVFSELGGKTKMDMRMALPTPEAAEETRKFIKKADGNSTWDRLAEYIAKETAQKDSFFINRSFAAPIETMYEMWTKPEHLSKWLPPTGFTMQFLKADIRVGGATFYVMTNGADVTMYGSSKYLELERPSRMVHTQQFCDKDEKVSRHPLAPTWPETMLVVVTLAEEGPNETRVTVESQAHGATTREELETFVGARGSMTGGWIGTFDKLDDVLAG